MQSRSDARVLVIHSSTRTVRSHLLLPSKIKNEMKKEEAKTNDPSIIIDNQLLLSFL